jgi:hypothetical protein
MDTIFAEAVTRIIELPQGTQRVIGEALLDGAGQTNLPVIEFTAEEHAMLDEAEASLAAGNAIGWEEMKRHFDELRAKSYAAL